MSPVTPPESWRFPVYAGAFMEARPVIGFLLSYWYFKDRELEELILPLEPRPPIFADSGAYSAMTQGGEVKLADYASWIERWGHLFDAYASLDVIKDPKATRRNHVALVKRGLSPVPVFHAGEPWRYLDQMLDESGYLAIGGLVGGPRGVRNPQMVGWLDDVWARVDGRAKVHGFGMTSWPLVQRYPWHSVDSSSIGSSYRYGTVRVYDPFSRRWYSWSVNDRRAWGQRGGLVREYGLAPADFDEPGSQGCSRSLMLLGARSLRRATIDLGGTRVYAADTSFAWRRQKGEGAGETVLETYHKGANTDDG